MAKSTVKIEGMTCGHCVETVTKALNALSGVSGALVTLEKKLACVDYDQEVISLPEIKKAIEKAGFEPEETG